MFIISSIFKIVQKKFLILLLKKNDFQQDIFNFQSIHISYLKVPDKPIQGSNNFRNFSHSFQISSNHAQKMQVNLFHALFHDFIFCVAI